MTPLLATDHERVVFCQYCVGLLCIGFGLVVNRVARNGPGRALPVDQQYLLVDGSGAVIMFGTLLVVWKSVIMIHHTTNTEASES